MSELKLFSDNEWAGLEVYLVEDASVRENPERKTLGELEGDARYRAAIVDGSGRVRKSLQVGLSREEIALEAKTWDYSPERENLYVQKIGGSYNARVA